MSDVARVVNVVCKPFAFEAMPSRGRPRKTAKVPAFENARRLKKTVPVKDAAGI